MERFGAIYGYRQEMRASSPRMLAPVFSSIVGGLVGALLLNRTPPTVLDALSYPESVNDTLANRRDDLKLFVALYRGYFSGHRHPDAGVLGLTDIHQMNRLKALLGASVNGIAALY